MSQEQRRSSETPASARGADALVGQVLEGRYEILRRIGVGGSSTVYEGRHLGLGRHVAVKVLHPSLAADPRVAEMIVREARTLGELGDPHIVGAMDVGVAPSGQRFMVMPLLRGRSLAAELKQTGRFSSERAVRLARQVASAMATAHARGLIHRDLKPDNIFVEKNGEGEDHAMVLDFGIAEFAGAGDGTATLVRSENVVGTPQPAYMAPEQLLDPSKADGRIDVYALGVVLYEMLAGRPLYSKQLVSDVVTYVLAGNYVPLRQVVPDVPREIELVVDKALDKNPAQRYQTMSELAMALRDALFAVVVPQLIADEPSRRVSLAALSGTPVAVPAVSPSPLAGRIPSRTPAAVGAIPSGTPAAVPAVQASPMWAVAPGTSSPLVVGIPGPVSPMVMMPGATAQPERRRGAAFWLFGVASLVAVAAASIALYRVVLQPSPTPPAPVAQEPAAPAPIELEIKSSAAGAQATVRGRAYPIPFKARFPRGEAPEMIEVTASGFEGRRSWVTLDRDLSLTVDLTPAVAPVAAPPPAAAPDLGSPPAVAPAPVPPTPRSPSRPSTPVAEPSEPPVPPHPGAAVFDSTSAQQVISQNMDAVQTCIERARNEDPSLSGKIVTRFIVGPKGQVRTVEIRSGAAKAPSLGGCLSDVAKRFQFAPPASGKDVDFLYVFDVE